MSPKQAPSWNTSIADPTLERLFDFAVYDRGAAGLQALRILMGDTPFFAMLKDWTTTHRDGNVTTADFLALVGAHGGSDAEAFLRTWITATSTPALPAKAQAAIDAL